MKARGLILIAAIGLFSGCQTKDPESVKKELAEMDRSESLKAKKIIPKIIVDKPPTAFSCFPLRIVLVDQATDEKVSFPEDKEIDIKSDSIAILFHSNPCSEEEMESNYVIPANKSEMTIYATAFEDKEYNLKTKIGSFVWNNTPDYKTKLKFSKKISKIEIAEGNNVKIIEDTFSDQKLKVKVTNEDGSLVEGAAIIFSSDGDASFLFGRIPYNEVPVNNGIAETSVWAPSVGNKRSKKFKVFARLKMNPDVGVVFDLTSVSR